MNLQGDWNTGRGKVLHLLYEKCDQTVRETCKTNDEITDFIKGKYFLLAYNKITFNEDEYGGKTFTNKTVLEWIPIQAGWT